MKRKDWKDKRRLFNFLSFQSFRFICILIQNRNEAVNSFILGFKQCFLNRFQLGCKGSKFAAKKVVKLSTFFESKMWIMFFETKFSKAFFFKSYPHVDKNFKNKTHFNTFIHNSTSNVDKCHFSNYFAPKVIHMWIKKIF